MTTWGTVTLTIKGSPHTFHVVPDNFPISEDAIIGRSLLQAKGAVVSYYYNALVIEDVMDPIPFLTKEERQYHLAIRRQNAGAAINLPEISRETSLNMLGTQNQA